MDNIESMTMPNENALNQIYQDEQDEQEHGRDDGFTVEVAKEPRAPLSAEELYERGRTLFLHNPSYTSVFLETVAACDGEARELSELEEFIASLPGYAKLKNPPYFPVSWLCEAGALEELYLDAEGKVYEAADVEELDEDAFDDLVAQYAYRTSDLGRKLRSEFGVDQRLAKLLESEPNRKETYLELLDFMRVKRDFVEIERLLRGHDASVLMGENGMPVKPSLFIDKLGTTGAIAFDDGWMTTAEGKEMLESIVNA